MEKWLPRLVPNGENITIRHSSTPMRMSTPASAKRSSKDMHLEVMKHPNLAPCSCASAASADMAGNRNSCRAAKALAVSASRRKEAISSSVGGVRRYRKGSRSSGPVTRNLRERGVR